MGYNLDLEMYKGPIEKLLELVEEKKMEITLVSLSKVTEDFLAYFEKLEQSLEGKDYDGDLKTILADFIVVASRLLLIKSRVLIPSLSFSEEEEEEVHDLELRLRLYQELKPVRILLSKIWSEQPFMAHREFLMNKEPFFYPSKNLNSEELLNSINRIAGELEKFLIPTSKIKIEIINLKSKIEEVLLKISDQPMGMRDLHDKKTRGELVVLFLAVLHLIKNQLIHVEQDAVFGNIMIAKKSNSL